MKLAQALNDHQFPPKAQEIFLTSGIINLYPPQAQAIQKGVLKGAHLCMSVPTAAGKTLIAELCMIRSILNDQGRCLYIAPLKALASEKYHDFKKKYAALGIEVGLAIGDADSPVRKLDQTNILVATAEKVDSLLRFKAKNLIETLTTVILDEIHFINDGSRGPTMEILIARIKQLNPKIQILALSATVSNANEMADWLGAQLVVSDWRPIPLKEGVYFNRKIMFEKYGQRLIGEDADDDLNNLTLDTLRAGGQVLIFVNSRRSAQAVSRQIASSVAQTLTDKEKEQLLTLSKKIAGPKSDTTKVCQKLSEVIRFGVAFHHAGLKPQQRELIEDNFRNNLIKVISCTPTLAAGVNLPARRAIIRDIKRYENGLGMSYIPTSEYKQCAGRAGRPQYDEYGEAVLIAKSPNEADTLRERYILADPEPIISKLANESALRMHILASIAGGYIHDVNGMFEFIKHTFLYHQKRSANLLAMIGDIFTFLHEEHFIEKSGYRFFATTLGNLTSRLYIDPMTSITIRDGLNRLDPSTPLPVLGMLHVLCCSPDGPLLKVNKKDPELLEKFAAYNKDDLIFKPDDWPNLEDFYGYLATLKTTWMLCQWIEEEKEDPICDQFGIGPGDIYRHVESIQWLLYAATRIAELLQKKRLTFEIENLRQRVRYGIKEELLEIVQLKGIGRIRARILHDHGFKTLNDFKFITDEKLGGIKQIGKSIAKDIIAQVSQMPA